MTRIAICRRGAVAAVVLLLAAGGGPALSQQAPGTLKQQLVGTWALHSIRVTHPDGTTTKPYGPHRRGILIFEANGHFAHILTNPDTPKYASGLINKPTAKEAMAAARGTFSFFGTYTVDEATKSFVFHIEGSSFPNFVGADQKRIVARITPNALEFVNLTPPSGGPKAELAYSRVR